MIRKNMVPAMRISSFWLAEWSDVKHGCDGLFLFLIGRNSNQKSYVYIIYLYFFISLFLNKPYP